MKIVEVTLDYDEYLTFSDSEMHEIRPNTVNSMLLFEVEPGNYEVYLVKIYADKNSDNVGFNELNFGLVPETFSGSMWIFDWDENPIGGWRIVDGEKTRFYARTHGASKGNGRATRTNEQRCYQIDTYWYQIVCMGSKCTDPILISYSTYIECEQIIAPPDPYDPGGGGGDQGDCLEPHPYIEGLMVPCPDVSLEEAAGDKPIMEYADKCQGLQDIWNNYPNNEVSGYITNDGQLLVIDILPLNGGATWGTYRYNGVSYYPYPVSQGAPANSYAGMVQSAGYYLIPVVASVHTHSPCRTDGTNGVSHPVGNEDRVRASEQNAHINHWVIGCGAIAQYDGNSENFYNVQTGNLLSLCQNIQ